uniref:Uncharacterized protein n=1 Tax=Panagrolaimus sp. PS1159 TaxID=55785 RepID=A0AC35F571_9BILA
MHSFYLYTLSLIFIVTVSPAQLHNNPVDHNGKEKQGTLVLDCYEQITRKMAETYESFTVYSGGPEMCLIFLPENVEVSYTELNFTHPDTYTRVLAGAAKKRVTYRYAPIFRSNSTEDYGIFNVQCPFGLIAFKSYSNSIGSESIEFTLNVTYDPAAWSVTCPTLISNDGSS